LVNLYIQNIAAIYSWLEQGKWLFYGYNFQALKLLQKIDDFNLENRACRVTFARFTRPPALLSPELLIRFAKKFHSTRNA